MADRIWLSNEFGSSRVVQQRPEADSDQQHSDPHIPQRAIEPELPAGEEIAQQMSIGREQRSIRGCFLRMPADEAVIHLRYGDSLEGALRERFVRGEVRSLERDCGGGG